MSDKKEFRRLRKAILFQRKKDIINLKACYLTGKSADRQARQSIAIKMKVSKDDYKKNLKGIKTEAKKAIREAKASESGNAIQERLDKLEEQAAEKWEGEIRPGAADAGEGSDYTTTLEAEQIARLRKAEGLPDYTHGEEVFNAVTHIVGGGLGVIGLTVGVVFAAICKGTVAAWAMALFGLSMIVLYTMSSVYHALHINRAKKVFQIIDHCTIYILIAGTYTPICLIVLSGFTYWNYVILGAVYLLAALGIVLNATMMDRFPVKVISQALYLIMGWLIVFFYSRLIGPLGPVGVWLLIGGGISYTFGAILYGLGKKIRYFHSVFHIFVVIGTLMQYMGILLYGIIGI